MRKPVLRLSPVLWGLVFAVLPAAIFAQDWYVSNAAGMTLERAFSRFALRNKYALSVEQIPLEDLPERLRAYYEPPYQIELRILYENGTESRRQWIYRDERGISRLVAAFGEDGSGFIERYNADERIVEEHQIAGDGSTYSTRYIYNNNLLIRAETQFFTPFPSPEEDPDSGDEGEDGTEGGGETDGEGETNGEVGTNGGTEPAYSAGSGNGTGGDSAESGITIAGAAPVPEGASAGSDAGGVLEDMWTDYYRYSRSYSLRAVERRYHHPPAEDQALVRLQFPHMILGAAGDMDFISPGSAYGSSFFSDIIVNSGDRVLYTTDERGRVLTEIRRDENDAILGELRNNWSGDRLASVTWQAGEDERLTEYEYDDEGDRIFERNYVNGVLERTVRQEADREVEELYMNGVVILRAVWEDGRKISEERVRPQPGRGE